MSPGAQTTKPRQMASIIVMQTMHLYKMLSGDLDLLAENPVAQVWLAALLRRQN
jgi:hypothetical protein